MKKPIIVTAQPNDAYFIWQNHLYIESCLEKGFEEDRIHILVYDPPGRIVNEDEWSILTKSYPKLKIFRYKDKGIFKFIPLYIPIIRPHILWQHFQLHPELEKETIIYTDSDILWLDNININHLIEDGICYISDAHSYMDASYFTRKYDDILPEKKEEAKKRDFLGEICSLVGIDKKVVEENDKINTGGVQYILKNINANFWKKVEKDCLLIRQHLLNVNKEFFESEAKGWQSWCADLWAVQFNLWYSNKETKVVPEMEFAWSSDSISKLDKVGILHNAGVTGRKLGNIPVFYKGDYHRAKSPFSDPYLEELSKNESTLCNHFYVKKLIELKNKYKLI